MIVGTLCVVLGTISILAYTEYRARVALQEGAEEMQRMAERSQAEMSRLKAEANLRNAQQAEMNRIRQAAEEKMAMEQWAMKMAENAKEREFKSRFKPRKECNDPQLAWEKTVKCVNEKLNAKAQFNLSH